MSKQEFKEYLRFLGRLFPNANIPGITVDTDKEILDIWYDSFKKINLVDAKGMAKKYFQNEKGMFSYARLLNCRPPKIEDMF